VPGLRHLAKVFYFLKKSLSREPAQVALGIFSKKKIESLRSACLVGTWPRVFGNKDFETFAESQIRALGTIFLKETLLLCKADINGKLPSQSFFFTEGLIWHSAKPLLSNRQKTLSKAAFVV